MVATSAKHTGVRRYEHVVAHVNQVEIGVRTDPNPIADAGISFADGGSSVDLQVGPATGEQSAVEATSYAVPHKGAMPGYDLRCVLECHYSEICEDLIPDNVKFA